MFSDFLIPYIWDASGRIISLASLGVINIEAVSCRWASSFVTSSLKRIENGEIIITNSNNDRLSLFGNPGRSATLRIMSHRFWWRVCLNSSIGFAESYMLGEAECDDVATFLEIMIENRDLIVDMKSPLSSMTYAFAGMRRAVNAIETSLSNVHVHYDLSNEIFSAFLSPDMTYSCGIWLPKGRESKTSDDSLEQAQVRKLHRIIEQAKIKSSDHVLEIGTGWGSFAIEAVKLTGCKVTSLTLSVEQKAEADVRIAAAGFQDNIVVLVKDYRNLVAEGGTFDKVVSIEMLEHVGKDYLALYFGIVNKLLKKNGGIAVFQTSTMPETRYKGYNEGDDFIRKYIFPGAHLPSVSQLVASLNDGSKGSLIVDRIENIGGHYSKTLREWRLNFSTNFCDLILPVLKKKNPGITESAIEVFRKKWLFYFSLCEAGFKTKTLGVAIVTAAREGAVETLEGISL